MQMDITIYISVGVAFVLFALKVLVHALTPSTSKKSHESFMYHSKDIAKAYSHKEEYHLKGGEIMIVFVHADWSHSSKTLMHYWKQITRHYKGRLVTNTGSVQKSQEIKLRILDENNAHYHRFKRRYGVNIVPTIMGFKPRSGHASTNPNLDKFTFDETMYGLGQTYRALFTFIEKVYAGYTEDGGCTSGNILQQECYEYDSNDCDRKHARTQHGVKYTCETRNGLCTSSSEICPNMPCQGRETQGECSEVNTNECANTYTNDGNQCGVVFDYSKNSFVCTNYHQCEAPEVSAYSSGSISSL